MSGGARKVSRVLALGLAVVFVAGLFTGFRAAPAGASAADDLRRVSDQLKEKQDDLLRIQRQLDRHRQLLQQTKQRERSVFSELQRIEKRLHLTERELAVLEQQLAEARRQVEAITRELRAAEAQLARRIELLRGRVRAAYELGTVSYFEVLFSATTFSDFLTRLSVLQQIIGADIQLMREADAYRETVARRKAELEEARARVERLAAETRFKKASFEADKLQRERTLASLQSQAEEYLRAIEEQERLEDSISKDIAALQKEMARLGGLPTDRSQIKLRWPLDPQYRRITSPFGMRFHPVIRQYRMHKGLDIAAPTGANIYAAALGRVIYSGPLGGYGLTIIMDHGAGVSTLYAHASRLVLGVSNTVHPAGTVIAKVGSTGLSTGPHLHFEVRLDGKQVDPLGWLPR